ncbi:MAG: hypothetical protein ACYTBJ_25685 [Planctomycetota bacterium]|jgi:hypothetical protein
MSQCQYVKGGKRKYVLTARFNTKCHFGPERCVRTDYAAFYSGGRLVIEPFYEWDGPSGPAIDTDNFMDGSLVHDLLYQFMREGHLSRWKYRRKADKEMRLQCKQDGMSFIRRWYTWAAVRIGGHKASGGKWFWENKKTERSSIT